MINLQEALESDIRSGIEAAINAGDLPPYKLSAVVVEHPEKEGFGDYATPVALALAKHAKKSPMDIVEILVKHMPKKEYVGKIEAASPGFLNIWISKEWIQSRLDDVIEHPLCADIHVGDGKTVNLEFISANPTGPLTLGNIRTAFSADTLGNVLQCAGYNVVREYYVNDAGGQIRTLGESVMRRILQAQGEEIDFPDHLYQGEYVKDLAATIAEEYAEHENRTFSVDDLKDEECMRDVSVRATKINFEGIKRTIQEDLGITFDIWTSEQAIRDSGIIEKTLEKLRKKGLTYTKDGAEYVKTTEFGDDKDRPVVKKDGEYTYFAPDIGYHRDKYERKFNLIIDFFGADHQGYVPRLKAAMKALGHDTDALRVMIAQWVRLIKDGKEFKPSKRKGVVFGPKELIDEIGYDAARYFLVQHNLSSHMELDLDLAKEASERNPVYYIQYAYVRLQSIIRRAKEQDIIETIGDHVERADRVDIRDKGAFPLILMLYRFPEVISDIASTHAVHQLPQYAYELARAIHVFYRDVPVLAGDDREEIKNRLHVVLAARKVLEETLDLLRIDKPAVM